MHKLTLRCASGHEQAIRFDERGFTLDMVHDFAVMIAGGTLRSLCIEMPGHPCAWSHDGAPACGARVTFTIEEAPKVSAVEVPGLHPDRPAKGDDWDGDCG